MKKIINLFFVFLVLFSSFGIPVYADDYPKYGVISTTSQKGVNVRKEPSTTSESLSTGLGEGAIVTILDTVSSPDTNCSSGQWYKIKYLKDVQGYGYVCSSLINVLPVDSEFAASLMVFPESYRESLMALHAIYPNASFIPYMTGLDFNASVAAENGYNTGHSLIWDSNNTRNGLKNLNTYNYLTNTFKNNYPGGGATWYAPSAETIAYYMDPRNFFDERYIFMFESLYYDAQYYSIEGVEAILAGSFMHDAYVDYFESELPEDTQDMKKFSEVIMEAADNSELNPYYLASRIRQEVGSTRSSLVLGEYLEYPEYNGYYNFYNINAGGDNIVKNGLDYAYRNGWSSERTAIISGAIALSSSYVSSGQDTGYFQKWDVICGDNSTCYKHQYMQNIEAPYNEAAQTYKAYKDALGDNMKNIGYVFTIPVYDNMPNATILPDSANPISYLKELLINDNMVSDFNSLVYDYSITIPSYITKLNIKANPIVSKVVITGTGDIAITGDKQVISVTVRASNNNVKTYNITVNLNDDYKLTLNDTITNLKANLKDNYLYNMKSVDDIKNNILNVNSFATIEITKNGEVTNTLSTGCKVKVTVGEENATYDVVVTGDASGDGAITAVDYVMIKNKIMGNLNLEGAYALAADVNDDKEITAVDYVNIKNYIMGNDSVIKR